MMEQRYLQNSLYYKLMILKNSKISVLQIQLFDIPSLIFLFLKMVINKVLKVFKNNYIIIYEKSIDSFTTFSQNAWAP